MGISVFEIMGATESDTLCGHFRSFFFPKLMYYFSTPSTMGILSLQNLECHCLNDELLNYAAQT
jgi:hypothetical protein